MALHPRAQARLGARASNVDMVRSDDGAFTGVAFCKYSSFEASTRAYSHLHGATVGGSMVSCEYASPSERPGSAGSRGGGGSGSGSGSGTGSGGAAGAGGVSGSSPLQRASGGNRRRARGFSEDWTKATASAGRRRMVERARRGSGSGLRGTKLRSMSMEQHGGPSGAGGGAGAARNNGSSNNNGSSSGAGGGSATDAGGVASTWRARRSRSLSNADTASKGGSPTTVTYAAGPDGSKGFQFKRNSGAAKPAPAPEAAQSKSTPKPKPAASATSSSSTSTNKSN